MSVILNLCQPGLIRKVTFEYRLARIKELVMDVRLGFHRRVCLSKVLENLEESCE